MKYCTFLFLIVFSLNSYSSIEMIETSALTAEESKALGFFKVVTSASNKTNSSSQIFITYPKTYKSNFEIIDAFLVAENSTGVIFKIPLKVEVTDNDLLNGSFINLIQPGAISLSLSVKYIDLNSKIHHNKSIKRD